MTLPGIPGASGSHGPQASSGTLGHFWTVGRRWRGLPNSFGRFVGGGGFAERFNRRGRCCGRKIGLKNRGTEFALHSFLRFRKKVRSKANFILDFGHALFELPCVKLLRKDLYPNWSSQELAGALCFQLLRAPHGAMRRRGVSGGVRSYCRAGRSLGCSLEVYPLRYLIRGNQYVGSVVALGNDVEANPYYIHEKTKSLTEAGRYSKGNTRESQIPSQADRQSMVLGRCSSNRVPNHQNR